MDLKLNLKIDILQSSGNLAESFEVNYTPAQIIEQIKQERLLTSFVFFLGIFFMITVYFVFKIFGRIMKYFRLKKVTEKLTKDKM